MASSSSRGAARRLIKELDNWHAETPEAHNKGIERLGPLSEDDLFVWEAVVNGRGVGNGYDGMLIFRFDSSFYPLPTALKVKIKKQKAAGSSPSSSPPTIPTPRPASPLSRPSSTPTSPSTRATSASTSSKTPGPPPTASSRPSAPSATACWPTPRLTPP